MCVFKGRRQDVNSAGFNILKDQLCKCFARRKIHSAYLLDPNDSHMFLNGSRNAFRCSCVLQLVLIDWRMDCQLCKVWSCTRQHLSCLQGTLCSLGLRCSANLFGEFSPVKNKSLIMSPAVINIAWGPVFGQMPLLREKHRTKPCYSFITVLVQPATKLLSIVTRFGLSSILWCYRTLQVLP